MSRDRGRLMGVRFDLVTIDSPHPDQLALFWRAVLALDEAEREDGDRWIVLADAAGTRRIGIQRGRARAGAMHLDLSCDAGGFDDELARLVAIGATLLSAARAEPYGRIANLADPDGNRFDLCSYI
ncbi:MAG: VOC family protein [Ilumatobacteraceae bacterium]